MRTLTASIMLERIQARLGDAGGLDFYYEALEEVLAIVSAGTWPWNWTEKTILTFPPVTETRLATWNAGDTYVTVVAGLTVSTNITGRRVVLPDNNVYRVVDVGLINPNRIYLDRQIVSTETDGVSLVFYRDAYFVQSSAVRNVSLGTNPKLARYSITIDLLGNWLGTVHRRAESYGQAAAYVDDESERVRPERPKYPPLVTSSGVGAFTNGRYIYFYTRYDPESGAESGPGPATVVNVTDGFRPSVIYNNPTVPDQSEWSTYRLRLYRSEVNPGYDHPAMFLRDSREAEALMVPFADSDPNGNGLLYSEERFYGGPWTGIFLPVAPDDRYHMVVDYLKNWGIRICPRDEIPLGPGSELGELYDLFMNAIRGSASRETREYRAGIIEFRRQLQYHLTKARTAGTTDMGPSNYYRSPKQLGNSMDDTYANDGWVGRLRWGSD